MSKMKKQEQLTQAADIYRGCMLQIKELEKKAAPYKKMLTDHGKVVELASIDLGSVVIEQRVSEKASINNRAAVTPDWFWRMQRDGFGDLVTIGIDSKKMGKCKDGKLGEYLDEVNCELKESITYAIRVNP